MLPAQAVGVSLSVPHWGLPFGGPCHPNILLNGIPALIIGSMTIPHPPPEAILDFPVPDFVSIGLPNVLFNGVPAIPEFAIAIHPKGSPSAVTVGFPNILLGGL